MTFSRKQQPHYFTYLLGDSTLTRVSSIRDLGVIFDSALTFHNHISTLAVESYRRLGFVLRNARDFENPKIIKLVFNTLVRSKLESASCIWTPYESSYILLIEKVQKAFLRAMYKIIFGYYPFLYPTKFLLGMLAYNSLSVRRARTQIIMAVKILRSIVDAPELHNILCKLYVPENYLRHRPSHRHRLFATAHYRTVSRAQSPLCRMRTAINALLDTAPDCDIFEDRWCAILAASLKFCETFDK